MRRIALLFVGVLLSMLPMSHVFAADIYAESLWSASAANVWTPEYAVGAPDGAYADFRNDDSFITLDMGTEVTSDLALSVYLIQYGARYLVTFYDTNFDVVTTSGDTIPLSTTTVTAPNTTGLPYRYVQVASVDTQQWRLDAVIATGADVEVPAEESEETANDTSAEPPTPSMLQGALVKSASSAAVYILGLDGYRHAFPTEREFASWGLSFDDVETVDDATIAAYDLGRNVTIRPGTYLVKLQTNPKVFAVEAGGVLRWVASESVALQLYGVDWASRVVDVSDAFWGNYTIGSDVTTPVHPDGSVLVYGGTRYYVADASTGQVDDETAVALRFSDDFAVEVANSAIIAQYASSVVSLLTQGAEWPY